MPNVLRAPDFPSFGEPVRMAIGWWPQAGRGNANNYGFSGHFFVAFLTAIFIQVRILRKFPFRR
jgi:hypothetical protein